MALNGRLEDMNLLEILQIVAFSKKTGTLEVRAQHAQGSILFRSGRLLCALSSSTAAAVRSLAGKPLDPAGQADLESQIRISLRELAALREGRFEFRLCRSLPVQWGGLDASGFLIGDGIDPQEILLGLAREIDEARRDTARLLETSDGLDAVEPEATSSDEGSAGDVSLAEAGLTVLVVDDEPLVVQIVSQELDDAGCVVESASGTEEAVDRLSFLLPRVKSSLVVVTDAGMPTSTGDGFDGGLEVIERLRSLGGPTAATPVLLMAESLSADARARARRLGVQKIAFKPTLTKLDPEEYGADLRSFARALRRELSDIALVSRDRPTSPPEEPHLNHEAIFDFLKTMTDQLAAPANGITRMILRVASKYVERAVLFLVKEGRASGLAGTHHGRPTAEVVDEVRAIAFELHHVQPFAEVVYSRSPVRITEGREPVVPALDPGRSREQVLFPLLHNHEVLAVLYCDNPTTGAPLSKLTGLSLFLVQAGMALENASLHRRLQSISSRYSLEDQGPLTQELTPIVRNGR
jgi:CheY-like chemotaxis protein